MGTDDERGRTKFNNTIKIGELETFSTKNWQILGVKNLIIYTGSKIFHVVFDFKRILGTISKQ